MYMTDHQKLAEARALSIALDKLTRNPRKVTPSAPIIIPALMVFVALFAIISIVIKLFMNYLNRKQQNTKTFALSETSSPEIPNTPEHDQASMATTASMKTRGSLRHSSKRRRNKPPPVSLYQIKQMQSPGSATSSKSKQHRAALKAMSRAAKAEANRGVSRGSSRQINDGSDDNMPNDGDNSPTNLSQHSDDMTDEIQAGANQSGLAFAARSGYNEQEGAGLPSQSGANQPEIHIVQIRDIEDNTQHSQPTWPQTESDI